MLLPKNLPQRSSTEDVPNGADDDLEVVWLQVRNKRVNTCKVLEGGKDWHQGLVGAQLGTPSN